MNIILLTHLIYAIIHYYNMAEAIFIGTAVCNFDKYQINNTYKKNEGPSKKRKIYNFASLILSNLFLLTRAFFSLNSSQFINNIHI